MRSLKRVLGTLKEARARSKEEVLRSDDNRFRSERELLTGELCRHLQDVSINAILLEPKSPEAFRNPYYVLGDVKIEGRNIDAILVQWSAGDFEKSDSHYRYFYVVRASLDGLESKLKADFKSNWHDRCSQKPNFYQFDKTLMDKELSNSYWEGKELAQLLNNDPELTQKLYNEGLDCLTVRPDKGDQCVRIEHSHWTLYLSDGEVHIRTGSVGRKQFPSRGTFEAYEEIAYAIRRVILTSSQKSSLTLEYPLILHCPKCGIELTIEADLCLQCGKNLPHPTTISK